MIKYKELWNKWHARCSQNLSTNLVFAILAIDFISIFFPGMMSLDSQGYYSEAINHSYSDHNCPLLSYLWHYLNYIHEGPMLMYIINMLLLWSGIYILSLQIFNKTKYLKFMCLIIPFMPQIIVYAGWIWKDLVFSFGYGLLSVYLAKKTLQKEKISLPISILFSLGLIYFTAAKFQAQFIAPIIIYWFFYVQNKCTFTFKLFLSSTVAVLCLVMSINGIKSFIVTEHGSGSNHSWQYVKIFDLAGMSLNAEHILMPKSLLKNPNIELQDIANAYTLAWEPLLYSENAPFRHPLNDQERQVLLDAWKTAVTKHPLSYLQHRFSRWSQGLFLASPGKMFFQKKLAEHPVMAQYLVPICTLTAFIYLLPFILASWIIAIITRLDPELSSYAQVTLFLLSMGHALLAVLFFKSLASDPRYVYFVVYTFMLSLPFTMHCVWQRILKRWALGVASSK